ncbi:MAG: polysaccharide deacetylase family protein, partial [Flavisolibacter sp.]|nr:polysaccharide deacetylase family protein [Flavisolibacter sp.]
MLLFFWLICFAAGCAKYNREGFLPEPGVALTFDDSYIDEWYQQINLFDSFDVKATFYISNYNAFSPEQKRKLHALE